MTDSKRVVEICTQYAQKGMFNIFLTVFFSTLAFAFLEPYFFIGYLISIALFGLYQAVFMANAGGAWDNAKKIVETELKEKGSPLHAATVVGDTVGDPFKDTSSVAMNPVIKFTTLFGLLAVELAVSLTAEQRPRPEPGAQPRVPRGLDGLRLALVLRHAHSQRDAGGAGRRPGAGGGGGGREVGGRARRPGQRATDRPLRASRSRPLGRLRRARGHRLHRDGAADRLLPARGLAADQRPGWWRPPAG